MEIQNINRQFPYTPSREKPEILERKSVGRENLLKDLLTSIKEQTQKKTHQHWLLIGPRGIGKTHIIALLNHRVKTNPKLHAKWITIWIPEEAAGILTLRDFFEKVFRIFIEEFKNEESIEELKSFEEILESTHQEINDRRVLNSMTAFLMDWKKRNQCKILVFVENANRVIGNRIAKSLPDEKWLRDLLMNKDLFLLVATSQSLFKQIEIMDHPLFELFRIEMIEDFSFDESLELLIKYAEEDKRDDLVKQFKLRSNRIEALHTLTGGNPRLLVMLYILIQTSISAIEDLENGFFHLLEDLTPYFQSRMAQLNAQQEKVLVAFAEGPELLTPAEVGRKIRMPTNHVTANLKRLQSGGFIKRIEKPIKGRKGTLYRLSETIYRYWYQMNSERNREMAEIFIRFIVIYYTYSEIEKIYKSKSTKSQTDKQISFSLKDAPKELQYLKVAMDIAKQEEKERLLTSLDKAIEERKTNEDIRKIYKELMELSPNDLFIMNSYAIFQIEQGEIQVGVVLFQKILELAEKNGTIEYQYGTYYNWGLALHYLAELKSDESIYRESFEKYALAVKYKEDFHKAYNNWGNALSDLAELKSDESIYRESFEKYALAVKYKEDFHKAYNNWGNALSDLAELKSDESIYRESFEKYALAIKYKEDFHEAYNNWGNALSELAELKSDESLYRESFEKYALAVKYKEDFHEAYYNWGNALSNLAELKSDESLYRESFEKYLNSWDLIRKIEKFDHPLMVNSALRVIFIALLIKEKDEANQTFFELLASLPKVVNFKVVVPYFFSFFVSIAKYNKEGIEGNYLEQLLNTKFKNELSSLIPFRFLFKYLTTKDDSIIRRQPPEIQKLLKSIIEEIEEG